MVRGQKAFLGLQLEILNRTDDESIFAWNGYGRDAQGLLAISPAMFKDSDDVQRAIFDSERPPPTMTSKGLRIELHLMSQEWMSPRVKKRPFGTSKMVFAP